MVRMSIIGTWIGSPHSISKSVVKATCPSITVEQSVEVPPMSSVTSRSMPVSSARCRAPMTPPEGPDTARWIGERAAASSFSSPPFDLMTTALPLKPASRSRRCMVARYGPTVGLR